MRIIVAGIGEVGTHLATMLSDAKHDVVAIDPEESNLQQLHEVADVVTLQGSVTSPTTLKSAHVEKTDLLWRWRTRRRPILSARCWRNVWGLNRLWRALTTMSICH